MRKDNKKELAGDIISEFSITFPEVPKSFEGAVKQTIFNNLNEDKAKIERRKLKRRFVLPKVAVIILCAVLISGVGVVAIGWSQINQNLSKEGRYVPEEAIVNEVENTNVPLLEIDEVYIDGMMLTFTAHLPENATKIPAEAGDHVYINDQNCLLDKFVQGSKEKGSYFCKVDMAAAQFLGGNETFPVASGENITVKMQLYIDNGDEELGIDDAMDFSFQAKIGDSLSKNVAIMDQIIEVEDGLEVNITNSTISPSGILLKMKFVAKGEDAERLLNKYAGLNYYVEDEKGNRNYLLMYSDSAASSGYPIETGDDSVEWGVEIVRFDMNSSYIKMIPYTIEIDEQGKDIPASEKIDEEHAFVINLKTK